MTVVQTNRESTIFFRYQCDGKGPFWLRCSSYTSFHLFVYELTKHHLRCLSGLTELLAKKMCSFLQLHCLICSIARVKRSTPKILYDSIEFLSSPLLVQHLLLWSDPPAIDNLAAEWVCSWGCQSKCLVVLKQRNARPWQATIVVTPD